MHRNILKGEPFPNGINLLVTIYLDNRVEYEMRKQKVCRNLSIIKQGNCEVGTIRGKFICFQTASHVLH